MSMHQHLQQFASWLQQARLKKGLSQAELARRVEVDERTVSRWERGRSIPRPYSYPKIEQALGALPPELRPIAGVRERAAPFGKGEPHAAQARGDDSDPGTGHAGGYPRPFLVPPLPPQGVFGREQDLDALSARLALPDLSATEVPPVALLGMGGVGKTTLALWLGRHAGIRTRFPDGVLWAEVGPSPVLRTLLNGWGQALGIDLIPSRDEAACRDRLRDVLAERRVLLIVDDVWDVNHGSLFLVAGPRCCTLFTTREPPIAYTLATSKRTLRVDVLSPEASLQLLEALAPEGVAADRAAAQRLCKRLAFLPLALKLAGRLLANEAGVPRRMQRLLDELTEQRKARLALEQLEGRKGLEEESSVSLRAILGLSVNRLSKVDQERFAMLSVFGGEPLTWEIRAVSSVWECSQEEAEATTARLIQRGLVEPRPEDRYWMHALLADYAAERLEELEG